MTSRHPTFTILTNLAKNFNSGCHLCATTHSIINLLICFLLTSGFLLSSMVLD